MAKSAILKSSITKKYWMAFTGLFLCIFLLGHLAGNLQLIFGDALQFNQYALFMTTNPAVKILSYLTYASLLFHAIDGILLTIQNKKARPIDYAHNKPEANSRWASRNMAILGSLILIFIVLHMKTFWAVMHFDEKIPLQTTMIDVQPGMPAQEFYMTTTGSYLPVGNVEVRNVTEFYDPAAKVKIAEGYKDLYKITVDFFKDPEYGLLYTILYVLAMAVLAFHLLHGFASAFQSIGINSAKYKPTIRVVGKLFAVIVPLLFAIIPLYIHFFLKA
ncbi:succinate dehydrogenase cytochrome b subunit [Flavobacterium ardleyense]|uniref:succinate dehydrogenase cytochrome b subunit n=1 Tax=Flavobacterium ardleyense TaxID=2038737 RepID=UPI00298CAB87|nr:succinate dehydrogenase cytochrome b subunit [Flavobacterium ardleyense]